MAPSHTCLKVTGDLLSFKIRVMLGVLWPTPYTPRIHRLSVQERRQQRVPSHPWHRWSQQVDQTRPKFWPNTRPTRSFDKPPLKTPSFATTSRPSNKSTCPALSSSTRHQTNGHPSPSWTRFTRRCCHTSHGPLPLLWQKAPGRGMGWLRSVGSSP